MKINTLIQQPLFFLLIIISTSSAAVILPGDSLSATNPTKTWNSPNNTFTFSFLPNPIQQTPTTFFAAISFNTIPIWTAGPTAVDSSANLTFLPDGNLRLVNGSTGSLVWESATARRAVSSAELDETGNFVIKNSSGGIVWSSFDNPTDTLMPGQNFTVNNVLRNGVYSFRLDSSGNLTLKWNDSTMYYNNGLNSTTNNVSLTSPLLSLNPVGILSLFDPVIKGSIIMAYSSDYAENAQRYVKLDSDGNLRIYSSTGGSGVPRWAAVSDVCQIYGYCGRLGICSYNELNPVCGCPSKNFDLVDEKDSRKGCKRKVEISDCPGTATMLEMENTEFLTYPPELGSQVFFMGISACRLNCLVGAGCGASTSLADGTGLCYLKNPDYFSGYQSPALPSTSYVKVCGPVVANTPPPSLDGGESKNWKLRAWIVVLAVLGTLLVLVMLEGSVWWCCCRNSPKFGALSAQYALLEYASGAPVQFSYKELERAAKGFKDKLGAGGFGTVYRGVLANRTVVAVKKLEGIEQGEKQFRMEVATISSTHHLNLVRLIGFCSEGRHRLLVYEFMKNGSLDNFLFTAEGQPSKLLSWENRFSIALGTAKGITYLHEECRDCIVHCDIKPENILLDENCNAKVSDFGLAKLVNPKDHRYRTLTSVRGTRGYLAPEWLANLPITSKSDVYSYGMVLLEIVSGRRNFEVSPETNQKKFSLWAYEEFDKGSIEAIVDKRLPRHEVDMEQVTRMIQISFWCIQEQPSQRPMMGKVVQMLEGIMDIERPPAPKAVTEGSISGTSVNVSSTVSALSTFAASAPAPSSTSSLHIAGNNQSFLSGKNVDRISSSEVK